MTSKATAPAASDEGWEVVTQGAALMISFDADGDSFTGIYQGAEVIDAPTRDKPDNQFTQYQFTGVIAVTADGEVLPGIAGEFCGINGTYALDKAMSNVPVGHETRITRTREVDTGKGNPMISFRIEHRAVRG